MLCGVLCGKGDTGGRKTSEGPNFGQLGDLGTKGQGRLGWQLVVMAEIGPWDRKRF